MLPFSSGFAISKKVPANARRGWSPRLTARTRPGEEIFLGVESAEARPGRVRATSWLESPKRRVSREKGAGTGGTRTDEGRF